MFHSPLHTAKDPLIQQTSRKGDNIQTESWVLITSFKEIKEPH